MCVEEGEIEDAELVKIAERIDADYIKQLAILLLDSEKRFKDIRSELNSRGDHKPTNLCLDVLNAWKVNTPADAMRQKLVIALLELKCDDVAKTVATKNYSQTPSICLLGPTSSSGNGDSGGKQ